MTTTLLAPLRALLAAGALAAPLLLAVPALAQPAPPPAPQPPATTTTPGVPTRPPGMAADSHGNETAPTIQAAPGARGAGGIPVVGGAGGSAAPSSGTATAPKP